MSVKNTLNNITIEDSAIKSKTGLSHFKSIYKKHSNFSKNTIDIESTSNSFNSSEIIYFDIDNIGDLLLNITLYVKLTIIPEAEATNLNIVKEILYAFIDSISIKCNNKIIQTFTGYWIYIWYQLNGSKKNQHILYSSSLLESNKTNNVYKLHLPIPFWFSSCPDKAFPLLSLQNEKISIELKLIDFKKISKNNKICIENIKLICDYIDLDNDEKTNYINNSLEYVIEQVEYTSKSINAGMSSSNKIEIPRYAFVNELIWIFVNIDIDVDFTNYFNFWKDSKDSPEDHSDHSKNLTVLLNGKPIHSKLKSSYYRKIQNYQNHSKNILKNCIYSYSFGLYSDEIKPAGILSLNKYNIALLEMQILASPKERLLYIFIKKFNILRIKDGYLHLLV